MNPISDEPEDIKVEPQAEQQQEDQGQEDPPEASNADAGLEEAPDADHVTEEDQADAEEIFGPEAKDAERDSEQDTEESPPADVPADVGGGEEMDADLQQAEGLSCKFWCLSRTEGTNYVLLTCTGNTPHFY